jgi:hypothetical protein
LNPGPQRPEMWTDGRLRTSTTRTGRSGPFAGCRRMRPVGSVRGIVAGWLGLSLASRCENYRWMNRRLRPASRPSRRLNRAQRSRTRQRRRLSRVAFTMTHTVLGSSSEWRRADSNRRLRRCERRPAALQRTTTVCYGRSADRAIDSEPSRTRTFAGWRGFDRACALRPARAAQWHVPGIFPTTARRHEMRRVQNALCRGYRRVGEAGSWGQRWK